MDPTLASKRPLPRLLPPRPHAVPGQLLATTWSLVALLCLCLVVPAPGQEGGSGVLPAKPGAAPTDPGKQRPATPVEEAQRYLGQRDYEAAIAVCLEHLSPDSSNAELRDALAWAYIGRDRLCLPVPPTLEAFERDALENLPCDVELLPRATERRAEEMLRVEERLAPDLPESYAPLLQYYLRRGSYEDVRAQLERLSPLDERLPQELLITQLRRVRGPGPLRAATEYLLGTDLTALECTQFFRLITALVKAGNPAGALLAIESAPADSACQTRLRPAANLALEAGGFYEELWSLNRHIAAAQGAQAYFRSMLTSVLAAARFDTAWAADRLAFELENNAEAFPPAARELLEGVKTLLATSGGTAAAWADLAENKFLHPSTYGVIRDLLNLLAESLEPGYPRAVLARARAMDGRRLPLQAAALYEEAAGGRRPVLERRWDPRRPEYLRQAAALYFLMDDDASCLAMLDEVPDPKVADALLEGAAALRAGNGRRARAALERVRRAQLSDLMVEAAGRMLGLLDGEAGGAGAAGDGR